MILVFIGAPGSGKGTQAQSLSKKLGLGYISTGNLLRTEIENETPFGLKIKEAVEAGKFPSDAIIMDVFKKELATSDNKNILLDGIPRTLNQAHLMDALFPDLKTKIDIVVEFKIDESALLERILGRFSCKTCCATYHKDFNSPKVEGVCDFCGGTEFMIRPDDQEEVLKKRLELYYLETLPILEYYSSKGLVCSIDASLPPETVGEEIISIIKKKADKGE